MKVLQALSQMTEPTRPMEIGNTIGEKPIDVGRFLAELLKGDLAEKVDEEQNLWTVTEKGTEYLSSIEKEPLSQPPVTGSVTGSVTGTTPQPPETLLTIPSQSDLFRSIGEKFRGTPPGQLYRLLLHPGGALSQSIHVEEERLQVRLFQALAPPSSLILQLTVMVKRDFVPKLKILELMDEVEIVEVMTLVNHLGMTCLSWRRAEWRRSPTRRRHYT